MNPTAILFWAVAAGIGYLIDGGHGALIGALAAGSISLFASLRRH